MPGISRAASLDVAVELDRSKLADVDHDCIADIVEDALLTRYRPYLYLTGDEDYRPIDVDDYVPKSDMMRNEDFGNDSARAFRNDQLSQDPMLILQGFYSPNGAGFCTGADHNANVSACSSDLRINPQQRGYRINPKKHLDGFSGDFPGRHGADWGTVESRKNVGPYGHVAPIWDPTVAPGARYCRGDCPECRKQVALIWVGYKAYLPRTRSIPEKSNSNL